MIIESYKMKYITHVYVGSVNNIIIGRIIILKRIKLFLIFPIKK